MKRIPQHLKQANHFHMALLVNLFHNLQFFYLRGFICVCVFVLFSSFFAETIVLESLGHCQRETIQTTLKERSFKLGIMITFSYLTLSCRRPDMNSVVDWALKNNSLSIYPFMPLLITLTCFQSEDWRWKRSK